MKKEGVSATVSPEFYLKRIKHNYYNIWIKRVSFEGCEFEAGINTEAVSAAVLRLMSARLLQTQQQSMR